MAAICFFLISSYVVMLRIAVSLAEEDVHASTGPPMPKTGAVKAELTIPSGDHSAMPSGGEETEVSDDFSMLIAIIHAIYGHYRKFTSLYYVCSVYMIQDFNFRKRLKLPQKARCWTTTPQRQQRTIVRTRWKSRVSWKLILICIERNRVRNSVMARNCSACTLSRYSDSGILQFSWLMCRCSLPLDHLCQQQMRLRRGWQLLQEIRLRHLRVTSTWRWAKDFSASAAIIHGTYRYLSWVLLHFTICSV